MKKLLLLFLLTAGFQTGAFADSKIYPDNLIITVNGGSSDPIPAEVTVEKNTDGTINFRLQNFVMTLEGQSAYVGNIVVQNLTLSKDADAAYSTFSFDGNLLIEAGNLDGVAAEDWLGPMLGPLPLTLSGKITEKKLFVNIDLDLTEILNQIVNVRFGTDDFDNDENTQTYTDNLVITINEESSAPIQAKVDVQFNGDGTFNFLLRNFVMTMEGQSAYVGNIYIEGLTLNTESEKFGTFAYEGDLLIQEGNLDGVAASEWLGPMLGPLPLTLSGKLTAEKLYVNIDLDLREILNQVVNVRFGTDDFDTGVARVRYSHTSETYDLVGRRISVLQKGIYVKDGKKYLGK